MDGGQSLLQHEMEHGPDADSTAYGGHYAERQGVVCNPYSTLRCTWLRFGS